jgi:pyridoxine kinase
MPVRPPPSAASGRPPAARWFNGAVTTILSIQSSVAYGHVGNSAAVFPLQRLGVEVWPVHTVHFSNHTGYGEWRGPLLPADDVRAVITGVEERGAFPEVDAVLSGYQGGEDIGEVVLDAVARVKAANPAAIYACDPVMGNAKSGCFVHPAIPVLLRERVVPRADLITPNQFELGFLTHTEPESLEDTLASVEAARAMGPSTVLVTSVLRPDRPDDTIEMLAVHDDGAWIVQTPMLPLKANGSGDVTAALFTAHLLRTGDAGLALGRTVSSVFDLLQRTLQSGRRELQLVQSQTEIAEPRMQFEVERIQ